MRPTAKSRRAALRAGIATLAFAGLIATSQNARADSVSLVETGSSLLYPLFNIWVPDFTAANPGIKLTTQSTGSGAGISQATSGVVQVGASDAYLADALVKKNPDMLSIPLAISAQSVNFNLPGLNDKHIDLSGPVLADIYSGKITKWNDPAIAKLNPGVKLPAHAIIPVHRTDGSGDTFIFTQYLTKSTPSWANAVGFGTAVQWPAVTGELGATGNPGMVSALAGNPYSIAYVGVSFQAKIDSNKLGTAALGNKAGKFVLPTPETVGAAASSLVTATPPDERISLVFAEGANAYPIINYEYAIVKSNQPSKDVAAAVRTLLSWAITSGNDPKYLDQVHFLPLPKAIATLSQTQIAKIQ